MLQKICTSFNECDSLNLFLSPMFATYHFHKSSNKPQFLGISSFYLDVQLGKMNLHLSLAELAKVVIEKRRKLAPLITGGVITSLSLLSVFLYSPRMEIVLLIGFGLLLTYFGLIEHTVIHIEHGNNTFLVWVPLRDKFEDVRPFVAILEYYVGRKQFPILYASPVNTDIASIIHHAEAPVKSTKTIIYQFGKDPFGKIPQVAVNPVLLDTPIAIQPTGKVISESNYLINSSAVINYNEGDLQ